MSTISYSKNEFSGYFKKYKGELDTEIKRVEGVVSQTENKISNLSKNDGKFLTETQISSLVKLAKEALVKSTSKLEELRQKSMDLNDGKLDHEVENMIKATREKQTEIRHEELQKNTMRQEEKSKKKKLLNDYHQRGRNEGSAMREYMRGVWRGQGYYFRNCEKIPDYMRKNLRNMPCNRGYIFNDICLFGEKEPELTRYKMSDGSFIMSEYPTTLFEKPRRDRNSNDSSMIIHEWHQDKILVFNKPNKASRKTLIEERPRVNRMDGITMANFIKKENLNTPTIVSTSSHTDHTPRYNSTKGKEPGNRYIPPNKRKQYQKPSSSGRTHNTPSDQAPKDNQKYKKKFPDKKGKKPYKKKNGDDKKNGDNSGDTQKKKKPYGKRPNPVSYTHLTLPTKA